MNKALTLVNAVCDPELDPGLERNYLKRGTVTSREIRTWAAH